MSDIAERLRNSLLKGDDPAFYMLRNVDIVEAANTVERLRAALHLAEKALTLRGPGWPLDEIRAALEGKP